MSKAISAKDALLHGRVVFNRDRLELSWPHSGFSLCFHGDGLTLWTRPMGLFQPAFIELCVDGTRVQVLPILADTDRVQVEGLTDADHTLRLLMLTEMQQELPLRIVGVTISGKNATLLPPDTPSPRRLLFLGDTLLCGPTVQEPAPHRDVTVGVAGLVTAYFHADIQLQAISGQGIFCNAAGESGRPIPTLFTASTPLNAAPWYGDAWQPQAVIISAGDADDKGGADETLLAKKSERFLITIRAVYPDTAILWMCDTQNERLLHVIRSVTQAWDRALFLPIQLQEAEMDSLPFHERTASLLIETIRTLTNWK